MPSHTDRIIIEEFENGGSYRIFHEKTGKEWCGVRYQDLLRIIDKII